MKINKHIYLIIFLPLFAFATAHKFYVSVTNVEYSEKDLALQITSRIFIDDLEDALNERYGIEANLATKDELRESNRYIEKYLKSKFKIEIDGAIVSYTYIGNEFDADVVVCYIEVPNIDLAEIASIEIENLILTDVFEEQQNIVHFKVSDEKKSFVLTKSNIKGMLNVKPAINKS